MLMLLAELGIEVSEGKIYRPNRNMRVSPGKSPYGTEIAAMLGGDSSVAFDGCGSTAVAGSYHLRAARRERYGSAVSADSSGA